MNQVLIFSTAPLGSGDADRWYFAPTQAGGAIIESDGVNPIYTFIVDQLNSKDNTGEATVTFTPIP
ncbi:MAG TPA: hypothetical protein DCR93_02645 [Cytophagales bacterium]|nr:hypothetical protein [Cytophagales bacterium]HAP58445.1 hypothetical protein [Cytophagales bacterium]